MSPSGPCLELRDKFLQLTTSGSLEHLDFAPDQAGWQVASRGLSSGGNSSGSQAVEAAIWVWTIVPPKPTVPRPAPGLNAGVGALCFPGAAALARDTRGPTTFLKHSNNFLLFTISLKVSNCQLSTKSCGNNMAYESYHDLWVRNRRAPQKIQHVPKNQMFSVIHKSFSLLKNTSNTMKKVHIGKLIWIRIFICQMVG